MNDLLTPSDIAELTGCIKPQKQCAILRDAGVRFIRRNDGRPSVTWTSINNTLSPFVAANDAGDGFNLEAL